MSAVATNSGALACAISDAFFLPFRDWAHNSAAAAELAETLAARGWDVSVAVCTDIRGAVRWRASLVHTLDFAAGDATADTMPMALCTAALKAHAGVPG